MVDKAEYLMWLRLGYLSASNAIDIRIMVIFSNAPRGRSEKCMSPETGATRRGVVGECDICRSEMGSSRYR